MERTKWECRTLTACPKKPFPRTSPWMRSEGLKMRWVRSPESRRRDSERTMSLLWDISDRAPGDNGHLSILQLRLMKKQRLSRKYGRQIWHKVSHEWAVTECFWIAFLWFLGALAARGSSWLVHLSPPLDSALPPDSEVCGLTWVSHGHRGHGSWCRWGDCLSEGGCRSKTVGCVQWSAAVVWLCPGSQSLSRGKDTIYVRHIWRLFISCSVLSVKYCCWGAQEASASH